MLGHFTTLCMKGLILDATFGDDPLLQKKKEDKNLKYTFHLTFTCSKLEIETAE